MEKRVLSKRRWLRLIPIVFITYSLAYHGFGAVAGMSASIFVLENLRINQSVSFFIWVLFFLGYLFFQIPAAHYAEKRSAKKLIFWSLILWGFLSAAIGIQTSMAGVFVFRFLLGAVESVALPAMLVFLSHWFTKEERSRANTFLFLGNPVTVLLMSVVSSFMLIAFDWRWMFIIEGLLVVIWAFIWWKFVDDKPEDAKWLNAQEKQDLTDALQNEQQGMKPIKNYWEAFKNGNVILLSLQYFFWSIGVSGFVLWLPVILKNASRFEIKAAGWLSSALAVIMMLVASHYSDWLLKRKVFVWPFLLAGAIAFYGSYALGNSNFWLSFVLLVIAGGAIYAPYGPFFAMVPEILPRNVAGGTIALINSMGTLGAFVGSYVVGYLNAVTGSPSASYNFMAVSLVLSVILTIAVKPPKTEQATQTPEG